MRKKIFLLSLPVFFSLTSCGLFKESCDCPKFGKNNPVKTEKQVQIAAEKAAENRQ